MGKQTIKERIRSLVYKIALPIYLWSIGFKTLEEYLSALEKENHYK